MAYTSLLAKIFASAAANTGLQAFLQAGPVFQWADTQLPQEWDITNHDAVVAIVVSNPKTYAAPGPMYTSMARVQFTIYGHGNDSQNADAVAQALFSWLQTLFVSNVPQQAANYVVGDRFGGIAQTDPLTYLRHIDVLIFNSDN